MTDRFDPANPEHVAIKKGIEIGDGIEAGLQASTWHHFLKRGMKQLEHVIKKRPQRTLLGSKFLSKLSERVVSAFWSMVAWLAVDGPGAKSEDIIKR